MHLYLPPSSTLYLPLTPLSLWPSPALQENETLHTTDHTLPYCDAPVLGLSDKFLLHDGALYLWQLNRRDYASPRSSYCVRALFKGTIGAGLEPVPCQELIAEHLNRAYALHPHPDFAALKVQAEWIMLGDSDYAPGEYTHFYIDFPEEHRMAGIVLVCEMIDTTFALRRTDRHVTYSFVDECYNDKYTGPDADALIMYLTVVVEGASAFGSIGVRDCWRLLNDLSLEAIRYIDNPASDQDMVGLLLSALPFF